MKKHIFLSVFSVFFALFGGVGVAHAATTYLPGCEKPTSISDLDKKFATICKSKPTNKPNGMYWTIYFDSGRELHGTAFCSTTSTGSAPASSDGGKYCWCGIESYTDGTTTFDSKPTAWTYVQSYTSKTSCKNSCPSACGSAIQKKSCNSGMCYTPPESTKYQVRYSCKAGTTSNTYSSGDTVTTLNGTQKCAAPSGYTFSGWSCDNNIGQVSGAGTFTMPAGDVTCTAIYENNTIALTWDGGGTPSSCTYGSTFDVPPPTPRDGYIFTGWRVPPMCSFTASEVNGMSGVASGFKNDSTGEYGASEQNASIYGLTTDNSWATELNTGIIKGIAKCSNKNGGVAGTLGTPSDTNGQYCWCRATNYTPNGGNQCNVASHSWVFRSDKFASNCALDCANGCAIDVMGSPDFRQAVFGLVCSFTASEVNGMSFVASGYKNDPTGVFGASESNASRYGLTTNNSWAVEFNTGIIKGMAKCSAKSGDNNNATWSAPSSNWSATESELTSASGTAQYCWCRATNYTSSGGSACNFSSSSWVFDVNGTTAHNCAYSCANYCAGSFQNQADFPRAMFNTQEEPEPEPEPEPASQCSLSGLDPSISADYDATHTRWKPISSTGYTMAEDLGTENSSDLNSGEWAVTFSYGTVKGMAKCSAKSGNNNRFKWSNASSDWSATESELTSASGEAQYCWCHATNYTPNGGNQCTVSSPSWVFDDNLGAASNCAYYCATDCVGLVMDSPDFRRAAFGVQ